MAAPWRRQHDKYHPTVCRRRCVSMTIRRELTVIDGRPTWHYISDGHVVLPGPITGHVETADGTRYDVTDHAIEVRPDHVDEVKHLIGERYAAEGHPHHTDGTPFIHAPKKGRK